MVSSEPSLAVVGGGAAGFFGAIAAAEAEPRLRVKILEAGQRPLTKVRISGGGRCNVTHNCFDPRQLVEFYPRGRRELLGLFHRFQPKDTLEWFLQRGVDLHAEADGRIFPCSNRSETIVNCLMESASKAGIELLKGRFVQSIERHDKGFILHFRKGGELYTDALLWATGSLPTSYELIANLGHRIVEPVPSLFTFEINDPLLEGMAGQSIAKVQIKLKVGTSQFVQQGPMLITHWGLSGPAVLKLSAFAARELYEAKYQAKLLVNLLNGLDQGEVEKRLHEIKAQNAAKVLNSFSPFDMSKRLWKRFIECSMLDPDSTWERLGNKQLRTMAQLLSAYPLRVIGKGVFKEEFVSCGGVDLKEVDFRTMESRKCPGLYFAGEVLNVDGVTGGFNFQNAWSTSWVAGRAIASAF